MSLSDAVTADPRRELDSLPSQKYLETLRLQHSSIVDLDAFASVISRLFPRLKTVTRLLPPDSTLQMIDHSPVFSAEHPWTELMLLVERHRGYRD